MADFQRIGVLARLRHREVVESLARLVKFLRADGRTVVVESSTAELLRGSAMAVNVAVDFPRDLDLVIVVGGDGSMLSAARDLAPHDVPLLGVNRGRLGFLTDILPEQMEVEVGKVLAGEYLLCERFLLAMRVDRNGRTIGTGLALNEVLLHTGKSVRMMDFELYINRQFVYSQRSDGLIISTPTGSTAYALSAGGPIMHPRLDAIVLVPMNPHTLSSRPIVVDGNAEIEIRVGTRNELHPEIACDGQQELISEPGDVIRIHKSPYSLRLIHPAGQNFYELCRTKLGWGSRLDSISRDPIIPDPDIDQ
ncbi:MAG: NAD(+) kinase [Porticoccaceae bacterium]